MNYSRILCLVLSLTIIIFTTSIYAQSDSTNQQISPLHEGSWSLQFRYNNSLGFESFKGSNISAKYHFTDKSALRFGVNLDFKNINQERVNSINNDDHTRIQKQDLNRINIGITSDYVYYFTTKNSVNAFISSGAIIGVSYFKNNSKDLFDIAPDSVSSIGYGKTNGWFAGAEFSFGVEWNISSNFSISGEYTTKFLYQYSKNSSTITRFGYNDSVNYGEIVSKGFSIEQSNVLIGISLYF